MALTPGPSAHVHAGSVLTAIIALVLSIMMALIANALSPAPAAAQTESPRRPSTCLAMAGLLQQPKLWPAAIGSSSQKFAQSQADKVRIRYAVHSTYRLESPQGIVLATDFAGRAGTGRLPDVVTMNHAHGTHYTTSPDPGIPHVLRGWGNSQAPASHYLEVGDVLVRNVTTDIYSGGVLIEADGNSIFIFEVAGLCIGHVGHLHHTLTPEHIAAIGRLDVLMIPVDGGLTLSIQGISELARQFRASIILPMHWFSGYSLQRFVDNISTSFAVDIRQKSELTVSLASLPASPTVIVLQPELGTGFGFGFGDGN